MNIEQLIAEANPVPQGTVPTGDSAQAHRTLAKVLASGEPARVAGPRLTWSRGLIAAGVSAGVVAAASVFVLNAPSAHVAQGGGGRHAMTAGTLLAKIAKLTARQPVPSVADSQYAYIETLIAAQEITSVGTDGSGQSEVSEAGPYKRQIWMSVSDLCKPGLLIPSPIAGQKEMVLGPDTHEGPCPDKGSLNDPTYRLLQTLPTDPQALLDLINKQEKGHGTSPAAEAFVTIGDLLREQIAPPALGAALERAAALIPGVTEVPDAVDAAGRHGPGVAFTDQGTEEEWIFDPATGQMMGTREIDVSTGKVVGSTAVIARAFVDHPGQVPHNS